MRRPTPSHELYAWYEKALRGEVVPMHEMEPHPGFYRRRLVKGGPWVPASIWMDQPTDPETGELTGPEELRAEVNGVPEDPALVWTYVCANPISETEYRFMHKDSAWARQYAPDDPKAKPREAIDHLKTPLAF